MKKSARAVSIIGGADGPTSVFIIGKNANLTLRQKIQRAKNKIRRLYVEKTLLYESHSLDEVMEYIVNRYGFVEVDVESAEATEEYRQMRASFILQYAPELLGEADALPELNGESEEAVRAYIRQCEERTQRAMEIPSAEFDIDFHKFEKTFADSNDHIDIVIEKKYAHIGGAATGNKAVKSFRRIYKDVYRYYGATKEDKISRSERYEDLVRILSIK